MQEAAERLEEIRQQIIELLAEAEEVLPSSGLTTTRAKAYWIPHILEALGEQGFSMCSMKETVAELRGEE